MCSTVETCTVDHHRSVQGAATGLVRRTESREGQEVSRALRRGAIATLTLLLGCKSATGTTVAGGVMMGVGGVTAASGAIGLLSSSEASSAAGISNPVDGTYTAITITGAAIFVIGIGFLVVGTSKREKELKERKKEKARRQRVQVRRRPRAVARSKGVAAARSLFARLGHLEVDEIERAFQSLAPVEQALFLAEWRSISKRKPSKKASAVLDRIGGNRRAVHTDVESVETTTTATLAPAREPFQVE